MESWLDMEGFGAVAVQGQHGHTVWGPGACIYQSLMMVHFVSQLMRNLLGTHLGHSAIYNMCRLMENRRVWAGPGVDG